MPYGAVETKIATIIVVSENPSSVIQNRMTTSGGNAIQNGRKFDIGVSIGRAVMPMPRTILTTNAKTVMIAMRRSVTRR
jgi:hypothetical protein